MSSNSNPNLGKNIYALDGLRGIAILSVIIHHCFYAPPAIPFSEQINCLLQSGRLGVGIFFVLSGFLMGCAVFGESGSFPVATYIKKRFARIYPPFILSIVFSSIIALLCKANLLEVFSSSMLYLSTIANWLHPAREINEVLWSLLIEIHFYIILPVLYLFVRKFFYNAAFITCVIFVSVPPLIRLWNFIFVDNYSDGWTAFQTVFPMRMDSFALGLFFSVIYLKKNFSKTSPIYTNNICSFGVFGLIITYIFYAMSFMLPYLSSMRCEGIFLEIAYIGITFSTFSLLWVVFDTSSIFSKFLSSRLLTFLGLISYEWYLFHYPLIYLCEFFAPHGSVTGYLIKVLTPLLGSLIIAYFVYRFFSKPIQKWIRGIPVS
ncbi:MAG: acyltransferase [Verrucomicrobia bacterium]|nr:MAG: acyltransferase [Verrucomicrobiota bacterium]